MPVPYWRLSAYYLCYFAFIGAFSPYFTLYLQSQGQSPSDIAILMSLMQLMRVVSPNLWGWLAERRNRRMGIVRGTALASLAAFLLFFFVSSFEGLFVAMALMAFFWSAALPLIECVTFAHLDTQGARYGSIRAWGSVGFIVAVLGIGYLLDHFAIDSLLWMLTLIFAGILAAAWAVPEARVRGGAQAAGSLRAVLRRPEVIVLLGACLLMSAAHGALYVFYSIHLVDHGYSTSLVGWMWTLGVLAEIGVFLAMPWLLKRFSLRAMLLFAFGCAVLRFLLIGWCVDWLTWLLFAQLLHGATFGAYHAAAVAAVNRFFAGALQARGQALYSSLSFGAGGMLGGLLSGWGWQAIGPAWTFTTSAAFALAGGWWVWRSLYLPIQDSVAASQGPGAVK